MSAQPLSVRQLEELLRRVFRGLERDVDLARLRGEVDREATLRRHRRSLAYAALLALLAAGAVVAGVILEWSRGGGA